MGARAPVAHALRSLLVGGVLYLLHLEKRRSPIVWIDQNPPTYSLELELLSKIHTQFEIRSKSVHERLYPNSKMLDPSKPDLDSDILIF